MLDHLTRRVPVRARLIVRESRLKTLKGARVQWKETKLYPDRADRLSCPIQLLTRGQTRDTGVRWRSRVAAGLWESPTRNRRASHLQRGRLRGPARRVR